MSPKRPRLGAFFRARADAWPDEAVDLEIRHHIEMRVDELMEEGLDEPSARAEAERAFGEVSRYRAECVALQRREVRRMDGRDRIESFARDVRLAVRGLRRAPLFTLTLLLTLGIGVGANTAIFTVVDAVLVRPLPYADVDRLVDVSPYDSETGFSLTQLYKGSALAWRDEADFLEAVGFWRRADRVWEREEGAVTRIEVVAMTPELVEIFGIEPLLGRSFTASDGAAGATPVALLGEERWASDFGRDRDVLGSMIVLDGAEYTIVGVMPKSFRYPITAPRDVWTALGADQINAMSERDQMGLVARLPVDSDSTVVHERAQVLQAALVEEGLELSGFAEARIAPIGRWRANRSTERALHVLMGGAFLILLVAGMNAANLLLVRGSSRQGEIAVRLALGAGRGHVVRQLAIEALLVAAAAAVLAILVSLATLESILAFAPNQVSGSAATPVELTGRVGLFTILLSAAVGLGFGAAPLFSAVTSAAARGIGARTTEGRGTRRWRAGLVVAEVALSVVLLVGAGLFGKSFATLVGTDAGFDAERVVTIQPGLVESRYPEDEDRRVYFQEAAELLRALPGVEGVALSSGAPPRSGITFGDAAMPEEGPIPSDQPDVFPFAWVDASFAEVFGLRFVAGRNFTEDEDLEARPHIIDVETARWLFGTERPIGERFRLGEDGEWSTVVGVVENLYLNGFDDGGAEMEWISPMPTDVSRGYFMLSVRTSGDPDELILPIREALATIDPGQPIDHIGVVADGLVDALERERFLVRLMSVFAALGLGLASLGTFGVVSYVVRQRYREIGVRLALGAAAEDVRRLVLREGLAMATAGIVVGLLLCIPLSGAVEGLLVEVTASDPVVIGMTVATAFLSALAATLGPARWASRVDPIEVLGAE